MALTRLLLLVLVLLALGCGMSHSVPSPSPAPEALQSRDLTGLFVGQVTLNGSQTTNPTYKDQPYQFTIPVAAKSLALIQFRPLATPAAPGNLVMVRCQGTSTTYFTQVGRADGSWIRIPVYVANPDTLKFTLYNSAGTGDLNKEAVAWNWSITTNPPEGAGEPDDDENPKTITDRNLGRTVSLTSRTDGSFYAVTNGPKDQEDWYKLTLDGCSTVTFNLTTSNATWGMWSLCLSLYDANGQLLGAQTEITGSSVSPQIRIGPGRQSCYLQVSGAPISIGIGASHSSYSLVGSSALTPTSRVSGIAANRHIVAFDPENGPTSAAVFEGKPVLFFADKATPYPRLKCARALVPAPSLTTDWDVSEVMEVYNSTFPCSISEVDGRLIFSVNKYPPGLMLAIAQRAHPRGSDDWTIYWAPNTGGSGGGTLFHVGDRLGLGLWQYNGTILYQRFGYAATNNPTNAGDWVLHSLPAVGSTSSNPLTGVSLAGCPALVATDRLPDNVTYQILISVATKPTPMGPSDWSQQTIQPATSVALGVQTYGDRLFILGGDHGSLFLVRSLTAAPRSQADYSVTSVLPNVADFWIPVGLFVTRQGLEAAYSRNRLSPLGAATCNSLSPTGPSDWTIGTLDQQLGSSLFYGAVMSDQGDGYLAYTHPAIGDNTQDIECITWPLACSP